MRMWIFMLIVMSCIPHALSAVAPESIRWTPEEVAWRRDHPVVRVGVFAGDHAPLESWVGGQAEGFAVDYMRALAGNAGLRIELHPYSDWTKVSFGPERMAFDVILAQPETPERSSRMIALRPFMYGSPTLVAREGDDRIRGNADLTTARIVVERRYRQLAEEIKQRFPQSTLVYASEGRVALEMVARGQADAYISSTVVRARTLLSHRSTDDLSLLGPVDIKVYGISPMVRKDLPVLAEILRKAEPTIGTRETIQMRERWGIDEALRLDPPAGRITTEEAALLRSMPKLRIGYEADRFPYTFSDEKGHFDGLSAEYVRLIGEKLGLQFELVPVANWSLLKRKVLAHEVDLIAAGSTNDFAPVEMLFSQPYEYFPEVIVTRVQGSPIASPRDLLERRIAVRSEAGLLDRLSVLTDRKLLVAVDSNEDGLAMVASGEVDAFVGTLPAIDSLIRTRYAAELRIVGPAGFDQELALGARPEYAALLPLFDRTLARIDAGQKQAIRARWLTTDYHYGVPWTWVIVLVSTALLVAGIIGFAYIRLRRASRAQSRAERSLAEQLDFQQTLLETIPYPVFVKNSEGRYEAVNRAYEDLFGIKRESILGRALDESLHIRGVDGAQLHSDELAWLNGATESRRELSMIDADGISHHVILWLHAIGSGEASKNGLLGTVVEISDIRNAEERARASEQRLSDITAAMPMTVFQFSVDASGRGRFTYVAGNVKTMLGVTSEQLVEDESVLFAHVRAEDRELLASRVAAAVSDLKPLASLDIRIRVRDEWHWLTTEGGQPRRLDDGSTEWSGYWIDTTDAYIQAEALREATAQAESAASMKASFLATMSHEIRTPMAGVLGLIELLSRTSLDREQASMLGMADDSAKAMLQILDDILDYSRIESARFEIAHHPFDPRQLVDSVTGLFSARAREKNLRLHAIQDWRVATHLMGDVTRLRQILTNLMSNAVKFTEHGNVTLSMELVGQKGRTQSLRFIISDTGIGISPENLRHLFQPFTQAEQSTSRQFGGTGLGLTISRRLATLMGGQLNLVSEPGLGTRAVFEVALETASETQDAPEFQGRQAWLQCAESLRRAELSNALSSLGFSVLEGEQPGDVFEDALHVVDDAWRVDAADTRPLIRIVDARRTDIPADLPGVRVSTDPILWHAVADACRSALGQPLANHPAIPALPAARWRAHILVAEDHPTNRAVIARQLETLGYNHSLVPDGLQALAALETVKFDLLITDCHMPNLDGFALTRHIRETETGDQHLPIIALSASALPEQVQRCIDAGMDDFLAKPVQLADLAEKLARQLPATAPRLMPSSTSATPSNSRAEDAMFQQLESVLGTREDVSKTLRELSATTHEDLNQYTRISPDDVRARADLLHRMEGALSLLSMMSPTHLPEEPTSASQREGAIRARLRELDALIQRQE